MKPIKNAISMQAAVATYTGMGVSRSSDDSPLQAAYQKFFRGKLAEFGVDSPDDIPHDKADDFFEEVKRDWKVRKESLGFSE